MRLPHSQVFVHKPSERILYLSFYLLGEVVVPGTVQSRTLLPSINWATFSPTAHSSSLQLSVPIREPTCLICSLILTVINCLDYAFVDAQGWICTNEPEGTVLQTAAFVLSSLLRQNDQP